MTRRHRLVWKIAAALGFMLLAACGRSPAVEGTLAPATAKQRQVRDAHGKPLDVPQLPQRVLVLSEIDLDAALALGVKPVGTTNGRGQKTPPPYLAQRIQGVQSVGNFNQPSLDRVIELQPDLILAGGNANAQLLQQLSQIAPTAVTFTPGEAWQDSFVRIGHLLGREAQAQAFLQDYRARTQALTNKLGANAGATVSIVRWTPQGPVYMLADAFASRVLADVGLERPVDQRQPGAGHSSPLSREALNRIDADWILVGSFADYQKNLADLQREPAFSRLQAVQKRHVATVDASLWTVIGGPLAARAVLDDLDRILTRPAI